MPKQQSSVGRMSPYRRYLEDRSYGRRRVGVMDQLYNRLAMDMVTRGERDDNFPQHFEQSESPFYSVQKYAGGGLFIRDQVAVSSPGGIFNMEFSNDGKILAAACERKSILIFDPLSRKLVRTIENAHSDCVNCVRFLDSRTFATCSDDTTVALWDARNLKSRMRTFRGHSNWVKNIEYHAGDNLLVTSGFDGAIYTWDINKYQETEAQYQKVFYTNGLMRMRLTPDASKMVISTMNGYLVVVHDLNLHSMSEDLAGFKPNMYRLMQISGKPLELAINYTKLFHTKRNRVEIISDFPDGNDAEVLSSLRLHPQGWVALSRNTSSDENTEWCCVHDIQTRPTNWEDDELISDRKPLMWRSGPTGGTLGSSSSSPDTTNTPRAQPRVQTFRAGRIEIISTGVDRGDSGGRPVIEIDLGLRRRTREMTGRDVEDDVGVTVDREMVEREEPDGEEEQVDGTQFLSANSLPTLNMIGELSGERREEESRRESETTDSRARTFNIVGASNLPANMGAPPARNPSGQEDAAESNEGTGGQRRGFLIIGPNRGGQVGRGRVLYFGTPGEHRAQQERIPKDARIHKNVNRLTHHIEESNTGKGFIKEQCFSPCGRFIVSPFGYGVRLLAFNEQGQDLSSCAPEDPVKLYEIGTKLGHEEVVLSTAFSPTHWLLASGCLQGRIVWHQPTP